MCSSHFLLCVFILFGTLSCDTNVCLSTRYVTVHVCYTNVPKSIKRHKRILDSHGWFSCAGPMARKRPSLRLVGGRNTHKEVGHKLQWYKGILELAGGIWKRSVHNYAKIALSILNFASSKVHIYFFCADIVNIVKIIFLIRPLS